MVIYIVTGCGAYLVYMCRCKSVNEVKYGKCSNSRAGNSECSGPITFIIKIIDQVGLNPQ